ncbi:MAG: PIN domain-containing protein [Thermodesulfovibrionia bacterium]|nr:PIN domain-containing protein [Thermodesulfovibrionia bacterium]
MTKEEKKIKRSDEHISYVLDTSALLTLWNDEEGADIVERIMRSGVLIYVSFMTFMEGRYRLWKNVGKGESDEFSQYLELLPVKRVNINDLIFEKSVEIKATNNLSVCDSWIIATAITTNSVLVHKDPEFEQVKKKIKLKTLPYKK